MFINSVVPIFSTKNIWRWDKTIHFVEFFILGFLFINAIIDTHLDIYKFLIGIFILTLIPTIDEGLDKKIFFHDSANGNLLKEISLPFIVGIEI